MATTTTLMKEDLEALKKDLRTLRDEVQLKIHLANMDLKTEWSKLEPQVERAWTDATHSSVVKAKELKTRLEDIVHRLNQ